MNYRKLNLDEDYSVIADMFVRSSMGVAPQKDTLPYDGLVAEKDGFIQGALFMYTISNAPIAILGFPILNPSYYGDRSGVMLNLIDRSEQILKYMGYTYVYTWSGTDAFVKYLKDMRYVEGDKDVTHFIKLLN